MEVDHQGSILPSYKKAYEIYEKYSEDQSRQINQINQNFNDYNLNIKIGPNVNIKLSKATTYTPEQKDWFDKKIKQTKKTEMCKNWVLYKDCFYKDKCSFAHGENELRTKKTENNVKYKTKICKAFVEKIFCPFGNRCQYRHIISKKRILSYSYLNSRFVSDLNLELTKEQKESDDFHKAITNVYLHSNMIK